MAKRKPTKANGATAPAPEFIPNEYLARAVMDWLDALGAAIRTQRRVEELAGPRRVEVQQAQERAARGEVGR